MANHILVCLDIEEMGGITSQQMCWLNDPLRIPRAIKDLNTQWPNSTVCVYQLSELQKLKTNPTYQKYKVSANGEVIPV